MRSRIVLGLCIGLLLAGSLSAAQFRFTGAVDELWSNPDNWREAALPGPADKAQFVNGVSAVLDYDAGVINNIAIEAGTSHLTLVDGAHVSVNDWTIVAYAGGSEEDPHTLNILGGTLDCQMRMYVGFQGYGKLVIDNDGVVNLHNQQFGVGQEADGNGRVELKGGSLNLLSSSGTPLLFRNGANSTASMDFSGGVMTQAYSEGRLAYVNTHIADGTITAYKGVGTVQVETIEDVLIVKGLHPLNPVPEDGALIRPVSEVELSWTVPDPCVPGQPVPVDVYFGTSPDFPIGGSPETPQIISKENITSVVVQVQAKTRYYWAVDAYVNGIDAPPVLGPVFSFVSDNMPPTVNAGDDVTTWLTDGVVAVNLDGTVTDEDAYTVQWTVVNEPSDPGSADAVIADPSAEDTVVTLSAVGEYVLQLEADDGEHTGSDTVTINVYSDSCEAAKSLPAYVPLAGDVNADCTVDAQDLALMAVNWLSNNAL